MRTVHEPEPPRTTTTTTNNGSNNDTGPNKKSGIKIKLTNGNASSSGPKPQNAPPTPTDSMMAMGPSHDEDGNPVTPSPANDNIQYIPAHHPLTGQPGFMITYPPDIHFTAWESSIAADQLLRLLRRQVHWAEKEGEQLKAECDNLESIKRQEYVLKELLLDGALEEGFERGKVEGWLDDTPGIATRMMEADAEPSRNIKWTNGTPAWRKEGFANNQQSRQQSRYESAQNSRDIEMPDASHAATPSAQPSAQRTPSPPPTGHSGGGFDGDADPYDNYLAGRMAEYYERERLRSLQNTPQKQGQEEKEQSREDREADAVGALVGLSGGQ